MLQDLENHPIVFKDYASQRCVIVVRRPDSGYVRELTSICARGIPSRPNSQPVESAQMGLHLQCMFVYNQWIQS